MSSKDFIEWNGVVKECYPNTTFRIVCDNGHELLGHLSGKMRKNYIKVLPGDLVIVQISPYDLGKGRIVKRVSEASRARGGAQGSPSDSSGGGSRS
jgi:translation initiation factor IF-1